MKKILTVYTGGTICSVSDGKQRNLAALTAKRTLIENFANSKSPYAHMCADLFEDAGLPSDSQTLSENMTLDKLWDIAHYIRRFNFEDYCGVIVLHGTDTLAFTSSFFSLLFCDAPVPLMLVAGNKPPEDMSGNANVNFRVAVELILGGIAPNVYVPYRNSDGTERLYLGSSLMQCANYSDDFFSSSPDKVFVIGEEQLFEKCRSYSTAGKYEINPFANIENLSDGVLLIKPYTGLDYGAISLDGVKAVVHGTYHSGTVCAERNTPDGGYSSKSVLHLAQKCDKADVPLFLAPTVLNSSQYSSVYDVVENGKAIPLNMTSESAYAKAVVGVSAGISGQELASFMTTYVSNEI